MNDLTLLSRLRTACVVCLLLPSLAVAQSDTLTISGTFQAAIVDGEPGSDLYDVYTNGQLHIWTLTMHGVTYEQDYAFDAYVDGYNEQYITRARSSNFTLEFIGPDGTTLNSVVSNQLADATVVLVNGALYDWFLDPVWTTPYIGFDVLLAPSEPDNGVQFQVSAGFETEWYAPFYPTFEPQEIRWTIESVIDQRSGTYGELNSYSLAAYIGSPVPPPPAPAQVSIGDVSTFEGNNGTRALALTLSLSGGPLSEPVSVQYQTIDGTATSSGTKKSPADYAAATGTVTFQPGQTGRTISILVKGDRKREANETFTVRISASSSQVEISDSAATATILNDD